MEAKAYKLKGRVEAIATKTCPLRNNGKIENVCSQCPDGCPLKDLNDSQNNPDRHPENFTDFYIENFEDGAKEVGEKLEYCVGPELYGYNWTKGTPKYWDELINYVNEIKNK